MLMSVRDMDVLRLLCWCQNVRPDDLSSISTETERENLITLGLIKRHQRSDTLLLTNSGRAFLQAALEGDVPNLTLSYHDAAIERRVRLSSLMMTAYHAGINVFTITANSLAETSTLFITAITRSRGHNPWGSARVGAIAHLGSTYYAVHYIYSGIGRMAVNDELAAFHNHTNFGKDTQRAFLFAGASYADIMEELKARDEKRDTKLIRYSEAYRGLHYPVHLLSCDETGARQLQIMAVPDYRVKISKLMLRSAYRPPPEDAPAWDATYQNRPFVIGADMNLRRIDAAIASAKKRGCLPISLAALDAQGDAVLLRRYKDTGYAVIYKVTESVLTELFGRPPSLYLPPCTQFLTKKGDVVDAPLTAGDLAAWGKAVALTLLEIAQSEGRKFALVHFSGPGRFQTDVFLPGQSSLEEKLHAAETFLGGGTDFQTPLAEAERLMREGGFENADIAFITDGECSLPETCVEMLQKAQSELRFTVTGILLDEGNAGMDFSLKPFCQNIYRTSELTGDQIVGEIVLDRV